METVKKEDWTYEYEGFQIRLDNRGRFHTPFDKDHQTHDSLGAAKSTIDKQNKLKQTKRPSYVTPCFLTGASISVGTYLGIHAKSGEVRFRPDGTKKVAALGYRDIHRMPTDREEFRRQVERRTMANAIVREVDKYLDEFKVRTPYGRTNLSVEELMTKERQLADLLEGKEK